ncbi:hypothetical protein HN011_003269, partial [Eciton burchellii]
MSTRCASDLTVLELREELRILGLIVTAWKNGLIARLNRSIPSGMWSELPMEAQMSGIMVEPRGAPETELEMVRRELELLMARLSAIDSAHCTHNAPKAHTSAETGWVQNKVSLNGIAELLLEFDGTVGDFRMWRNKLKILEQTYQLNDNHMKILVEQRLRGRTVAWLHSADEYMLLSTVELLKGLGAMFDQQLDSMVLQERFRARKWRKVESFSNYMHQKIILGNRVPIAEKQLLGGVSTKEELRSRLENVEDWDKKDEAKGEIGRYQPRLRDQNSEAETSGTGGRREQRKRNCFTCGQPNHVRKDCPKRAQGPKCYKC